MNLYNLFNLKEEFLYHLDKKSWLTLRQLSKKYYYFFDQSDLFWKGSRLMKILKYDHNKIILKIYENYCVKLYYRNAFILDEQIYTFFNHHNNQFMNLDIFPSKLRAFTFNGCINICHDDWNMSGVIQLPFQKNFLKYYDKPRIDNVVLLYWVNKNLNSPFNKDLLDYITQYLDRWGDGKCYGCCRYNRGNISHN